MKPQFLTHKDINNIIRLSQSVGWDYNHAEVMTILNTGTVFGHKQVNGEVVSSAAIIPYGEKAASIGMVIVHEEYRGKGLGLALTKACIDYVNEQTIIQLIATSEGRPMYEKIGFQQVGSVKKLISPTPCLKNMIIGCTAQVVPFQEKDLSQLMAVDEKAFGAKRDQFLIERIKQSNDCLVLKNEAGKVIGYGLAIFGPVHTVLGPIVAPDTSSAFQIVQQLRKKEGRSVRIDILSEHEDFQQLLVTCGFEWINEPPIMLLRTNETIHHQQLFAIAAQAFG